LKILLFILKLIALIVAAIEFILTIITLSVYHRLWKKDDNLSIRILNAVIKLDK